MNEIDNVLCSLAEYKVGMNEVIDDAIHIIKKLEVKVRFDQREKNSLKEKLAVMERRVEKLEEELAIKSGQSVDNGGKCEPVEEIVEEPDPICVGDECEVYTTQYDNKSRKLLGKVIVTRVPDCADGLYDTVFISAEDPDCVEVGTTGYVYESDLKKTGRRIEYQYV